MNEGSGNIVQRAHRLMQDFGDEVGSFLGLQRVAYSRLQRDHFQESYAIRFERCTLNVDLISNSKTKTEVVRSFNLQ